MPTVSSGKVLVTGASGYVASWVVRTLLEQGYSVRATVRSESKASHLRTIFSAYGDKLEFAIVEDMVKVGAFDDAVKGVDAIEHVASPCHTQADDPDELIVPAVNGVLHVLESARDYGASVKRIVMTSSCAAILERHDTPRVFTEADWNEQTLSDVKLNGRGADQLSKYMASKVLAERAAWDFVSKHKGEIGWDLVVLNPPWILGPVITEAKNAESMNSSMNVWYQIVLQNAINTKTEGQSWIDVRDLADAHVLALQKEEAEGNRIIVAEGTWKWQDWINAARICGVKASNSDSPYDAKKGIHYIAFDTTKAKQLLGMKYRSRQQCTTDIIEDFKARSWI
ncbi:NAD(P)-binding protein [Wolfiporia cocos MD-104 SS10]|uniref:NAD(P)-binding protein n=1 Tax=Wolfiporia cocos (strain MD-104) TaxID=742152 RepID=A0A2H3JLV1_WOLCO|nr:NAD(P)-binding protein [Wolfiporia cocos MD-104 SS10]